MWCSGAWRAIENDDAQMIVLGSDDGKGYGGDANMFVCVDRASKSCLYPIIQWICDAVACWRGRVGWIRRCCIKFRNLLLAVCVFGCVVFSFRRDW